MNFQIGHHGIDSHHEELFHLVTTLDKAIQKGDEEGVDSIILFLEDYVVTHFKEEEDIMLQHHYSGYAYHKQAHEIVRHQVEELRNNFNNNKPLTHVIFGIRRIIDSLTKHIQTIDIGIADIVRKDS